MVVYIVVSIVAALVSLGLSISVWVQCAQISSFSVVICIINVVIVIGAVIIGIISSRKTGSPAAILVIASIILVSGVALFIFRDKVFDFIVDVFGCIGCSSKSLPTKLIK